MMLRTFGTCSSHALACVGVSVVCALTPFFSAGVVLAASLSFSPASGTYPMGQNFTVGVAINAEGAQVNSSQGVITFDAGKLQVVNISRDGSPFNLWVQEPTFSNTAGTITYSGGGTSVLSGTRNIMSITFRGRTEGVALVGARDVKILAGAGQDATGTVGSASYIIGPSAAPAPAPTPQPATPSVGLGGGITPQPPRDITSPTHPEEEKWYSTTTARFRWSVTAGVIGTRTLLDKDATSTPTEVQTPPVAEITYTDLEDGVWYFHLSYQNRNGWGEPAHRKIQIDTTPPESFTLSVDPGDLTALLSFNTTDALSGVSEYRIQVDGIQVERASPNDLVDGERFRLSSLSPGEHTFTVIAVDEAGNSTAAEAIATVTGQLPGTSAATNEPTSPFGPVYWVSIIFMVLLGMSVGMLIFERKKFAEEKDRIKTEAVEASERLVNIFDVLREEIEEKVLTLAHKPNMTDIERQTLEGLKEALDISEELLDKEIEDVRKLVK